MKKLLYTASTFSHIRNFHLPYLEYFQQQGWTVHVACGGEEEVIPHADRTIQLSLQKRMLSFDNFRAAAALRTLIRTEGYGLISTHTALASFFTRLALMGMRERPQVVCTVHGYLFDEHTPRLRSCILRTAEKWMAPQTDLLLTMNDWDYRVAQQYHMGHRVASVPGMGVDIARLHCEPQDGIQLRKELGLAQDAFVILYPAEFSVRKSQQILIQAMAHLPDHTVLVLPGCGATWEECKELSARLGLESRILFPGQVSPMGRWYAMADVAASSSRIEGLPFHIMEAILCGLPVVASQVKGHVDLVKPGVTGLLYPYGDVQGCAKALLTLIQSAELRQQLSHQEQQMECYCLEQVLPKQMEQYERLLVHKQTLVS